MTIITRRMVSVIGLVGMYMCLCTGRSYSQENEKPKAAASERQAHLTTIIDLDSLVYPYYEWVSKDTALAWVMKPDGSVVGVPLIGESRTERSLSGADKAHQLKATQPYAMKMSPDGIKVLYLLGHPGSPAKAWRVGSLDGTDYTTGSLLSLPGLDLVWKRNSKEWVYGELAVTDGNLSGSVSHNYIDGVTPPVKITIKGSKPTLQASKMDYGSILGFRQDGIAIVPVSNNSPTTKAVDLYLMDTDKGVVLPEKHHVILPTGVKVGEMALSHAGDRIAWIFGTKGVRTIEGKPTTEYVFEVWMSNADGSDLKRVSGFPPHVLKVGVPVQRVTWAPAPMQWPLDDTAISLLQEDGLHLVKVK